MCNADMLLLIQPGFPIQVPRKLYEYMAINKPIFCVTESDSETAKIIYENDLGVVCDNEFTEIRQGLLESYRLWEDGNLNQLKKEGCNSFLNSSLTDDLIEKIDLVKSNNTN